MTTKHIAVLLANPKGPFISDSDFEYAKRHWRAERAAWLDHGIAAEFELDRVPGDLKAVCADLSSMSLDLALLPLANRRKRLLVADMDSTIIEQECIDELACEAGIGERVSEITERAMNGLIDFEDAVRERVGLLAGLPLETFEKVWRERITLTPGAKALIGTMRAAGARTALISGGFTDFTKRVAEQAGFHEHHANRLSRAGGKLTGKVGTPILGREAKRRILLELLERYGLAAKDAMAVGDGSNDIAMIKLAGCGVAFRAKPVVAAECDAKLDFSDLTGLLFLQGYRRTEFAVPE